MSGPVLQGDRASSERAELSAALARVGRGDRVALHEVYQRTASKLFGVCLRIFPEPSDAEDALQDAFVIVWQKAGSFDPARASPITWLVTLTRNRAIDRLRASGRRLTAPLDLAFDVVDDAPDAEACLIASDDRARVAQCMDTLASSDAMMIRTAFFEGVTYADIADRASVPVGTVKSRIRRALMKLKACLA